MARRNTKFILVALILLFVIRQFCYNFVLNGVNDTGSNFSSQFILEHLQLTANCLRRCLQNVVHKKATKQATLG